MELSEYVNVTIGVPRYTIGDSSVLHDRSHWSLVSSILSMVVYMLATLYHAYRKTRGLYVRPIGATLVFLCVAGILRFVYEVTPDDNVMVAAWVLDVFSATAWLVSMLKLKDRWLCTPGIAGFLIGLQSIVIMLVFDPIRVLHHVTISELTAAAMVVSMSMNNNKFVRLASIFLFVNSLGMLFWDVPSALIVSVPSNAVLHTFSLASTVLFVVCTTLSYRFRRKDPELLLREAELSTFLPAELTARV